MPTALMASMAQTAMVLYYEMLIFKEAIKMLNLNNANFDSEVNHSETPVIVDFWAPWCGPCRMMAPVFEKLADEYKNKLKFAKLNTDEEPQISQENAIRGIPCLVLFNKGQEVDRIVGALPEEQLRSKIDLILAKI